MRLLSKLVLTSNKRSLCLKKSVQIASSYSSCNKNPKTIRSISLYQCCSRAINIFLCSGSSAVSLYSYYASNIAVLASLLANIKAFLSFKIVEIGGGASRGTRMLNVGV